MTAEKAAVATLVEYLPRVYAVQDWNFLLRRLSLRAQFADTRAVEAMDLDTRVRNGLLEAGILTSGQLATYTRDQLRRLPGMGTKSVNSIQAELAVEGLSLSADPAEAGKKES